MKALGVLSLGLFVAGFWSVVALACVRREKAELSEPVVPEKCCPPPTEALLEIRFPEPVVEQVAVEPAVSEESGEPVGQGSEEPHSSAVTLSAFLTDPEVIEWSQRMDRLDASKRGPDGRYTEEISRGRIANLEYAYLQDLPDEGLMSRPLTDEERDFMILEDRNGWGTSMTEGWEYWLKTWGILVRPQPIPE